MHENGHQATHVATDEPVKKAKKPKPEIDVLYQRVKAARNALQAAKDKRARVVADEDRNVAEKDAELVDATKAFDAHVAKARR